MAEPSLQPPQPEPRPRYRWPWVLLAAVLLAILLAVFWMSREVERTRRLRQWISNPTNSAPARP